MKSFVAERAFLIVWTAKSNKYLCRGDVKASDALLRPSGTDVPVGISDG
jgi:hypothetical protein